MACCLSLVPAHLFEPRYFIAPVMVLGVNIPMVCYPIPLPRTALISCLQSKTSAYFSLAKNVAINAITMWIFLARPFRGVDGEQARFMY